MYILYILYIYILYKLYTYTLYILYIYINKLGKVECRMTHGNMKIYRLLLE